MDNFNCRECKKLLENIYDCDSCGYPYCGKCVKKIKCLNCECDSFSPSKFGELLLSNLPVECPKCKQLIEKKSLDKHIKENCNENELQCRICSNILKKRDMINHLSTKHEADLMRYFEDTSKYPPSKIKQTQNSPIPNKVNIPTHVVLKWPNGSHTYTHDSTRFYTFTCSSIAITNYQIVKIFIKSGLNHGHIVLGFTVNIINDTQNGSYLGGGFGDKNWGIAGNGSIGEEGKWTTGIGFKEGDIVDLIYYNGEISYAVNGVSSNYAYRFKQFIPTHVYLAATVYYHKTTLVII
jgi:hypothetical protein